jgi:hypothetical protein
MSVELLVSSFEYMTALPGETTPESEGNYDIHNIITIRIWQGVAMGSLKLKLGPLCLTILRHAGGPALKQPQCCLTGSPPVGRAVCCSFLPLWMLYAHGQRPRVTTLLPRSDMVLWFSKSKFPPLSTLGTNRAPIGHQ